MSIGPGLSAGSRWSVSGVLSWFKAEALLERLGLIKALKENPRKGDSVDEQLLDVRVAGLSGQSSEQIFSIYFHCL